MGVRLERLLDEIEVRAVVGDVSAIDVDDVAYDSDAAGPGSLFCCLRGSHADGHDFAAGAVAAGAVALLVERQLPAPVPQVVVDDTRSAMAKVAAGLFGHPSRRLTVVGITGTNGKTTTTYLLQGALRAAGWNTEVIGTLSGSRTTPEAPQLQRTLADLAGNGTRAVAMEVSSHALKLRRVDGTWFSVTVFTNLSPEHLDFHGSMDDYFATKASLFAPERTATAVVNADDTYGRRLLGSVLVPTRAFSLRDADTVDIGPMGTTFRWRGQTVRLAPGGKANVANALAAAMTAEQLGVEPPIIAEGLSSVVVIPGRFEKVEAGQPFLVLVDYAHTPAGLEAVLGTARRAVGGGRVIVTFGCGGDRDRQKRPLMGEVAARLADLVVLTSDNPRHEDQLAIIGEVRAGTGDGDTVVVEPDRRTAIAMALKAACPGDAVVIAGKGHETTQVIGDRAEPFDDRVVAREELERLADQEGASWSRS